MTYRVKNLPAMQETQKTDVGLIPGSVRCPGGGHGSPKSSILAWRIPWREEPGGLQSNKVSKSQRRLK